MEHKEVFVLGDTITISEYFLFNIMKNVKHNPVIYLFEKKLRRNSVLVDDIFICILNIFARFSK